MRVRYAWRAGDKRFACARSRVCVPAKHVFRARVERCASARERCTCARGVNFLGRGRRCKFTRRLMCVDIRYGVLARER